MKYRLQETRDYRRFSFTNENRPVYILNLTPQHKKLRESMREFGFLPSFPLMVREVGNRLVIIDGQHRFTFAKEFGLAVYFVVVDTKLDIARLNGTQRSWGVKDHASRWAKDVTCPQHADYQEAIDFAERYGVTLSFAFAMLAGTIVFKNIETQFHGGTFKVKNRELANRVGETYRSMVAIRRFLHNGNFLAALWACSHVDYFDSARLIEKATRRPEMLTQYATRESYIEMLEEIYNFNQRTRAPLKFDAQEIMRLRITNLKKTPTAAVTPLARRAA